MDTTHDASSESTLGGGSNIAINRNVHRDTDDINVAEPCAIPQKKKRREPSFPTPDMKFGRRSMSRSDIMDTLMLQVQLIKSNSPLKDWVVMNGPRSGTVKTYQDYRLATVSWLTEVIPLYAHADAYTLIPSTVSLLDRYVLALLADDAKLEDVLRDSRTLRAACFLVACNMHNVYYIPATRTVCAANAHPVSAGVAVDEGSKLYASKCEVIHKQQDITVTLQGNLFPSVHVNAAELICMYMILDYACETSEPVQYALQAEVLSVTLKLFAGHVLFVGLLKYDTVLCMAVCCALAIIRVFTNVDKPQILKCMNGLLQIANYELVSDVEFAKVTSLLTQRCVVCDNNIANSNVRSVLRTLLAVSCDVCCNVI